MYIEKYLCHAWLSLKSQIIEPSYMFIDANIVQQGVLLDT